jgi:hypothetical protein
MKQESDGSWTQLNSGDAISVGTVLSIIATPNNGIRHVFHHWSAISDSDIIFGDETKGITTFTMPADDAHLTANFTNTTPVIRILEARNAADSVCTNNALSDISEVYAGEHLCVRGQFFEVGDVINIELHSTPFSLSTATVDEFGRFALAVQAPSAEVAAANNIDLDIEHDLVAYSADYNYAQAEAANATVKVKVLLKTPEEQNGGGNGDGIPPYTPDTPAPPNVIIPSDPNDPLSEGGTCSVEALSKDDCLDKGGIWTPKPSPPAGTEVPADPFNPGLGTGKCTVDAYSRPNCEAKEGEWTQLTGPGANLQNPSTDHADKLGDGLSTTGTGTQMLLFILLMLSVAGGALGAFARHRRCSM